jgi:hypothetical protein
LAPHNFFQGQKMTKPNFADITYLRICLFNNASDQELLVNRTKYKLTVGAKKASSTDFMNFTFSMNTKGVWALRRGKLFDQGIVDDDSHYQTLIMNWQQLRESGEFDRDCPPRVSKAYQTSNRRAGKTAIPYVSAMLWSQYENYCVNLLMGDTEWAEVLSPAGLTEAERKSRMVAKTVWTKEQAGVFDWSKTSWV